MAGNSEIAGGSMTPGALASFSAQHALSGLHGFQRDAAEYAFHRLFTAADSTRRFLIADEVGLGKTLIAKGVVARAIEHLRGRVDRIDIVYICSNLGIARQNIHRLNPLEHKQFADAQRITLLPLHMRGVQPDDVNLVAFTPGTSLNLTQNLGVRRERVLLYALLEQIWTLKGAGPLNVLQGEVQNTEGFRWEAKELRKEFADDLARSAGLIGEFDRELVQDPSIRARFDALSEMFKRTRQHVPEEERKERNAVIGLLRSTLARVCIASLEPDLIILDEFQRFKDLLAPESEAGELAQQLFQWSNGNAHAHVLLLSATPYKPYTLQHEINEENHYADFLRTLRFLHKGDAAVEQIEPGIRQFRQELLRGPGASVAQLEKLKADIERGLRRVMSRTERLAAAGEHNGMLRSVVHDDLAIDAGDLRSYVDMRRIGDAIEADDPLEYWKAAPYTMNFMEGYKFGAALRDHATVPSQDAQLAGCLDGIARSTLPGDKLINHEAIEFQNAKFRRLVSNLDALSAFDVLWLPPSLPAYQCEGAFAQARQQGITKRLIFSAWNVVPRSIAALLSYEAERRGVGADPATSKDGETSSAERGSLLKVSRADGRSTGMPTLALMYPATTLAKLCDPRVFAKELGERTPTLEEALAWARERIRDTLPKDLNWAEEGKASDESWYWQAPILLDHLVDPEGTRRWFEQPTLASLWSTPPHHESSEDDDTADAGWAEHVADATEVARGTNWPTGPVPADLLDVLALLGIAGPAVCALRALWRLLPSEADNQDSCVRIAAAQQGWSFRRLLNRPQATALIRRGDRAKPFWRLALEYCAKGCLGSVLEEYAHVLRDATGATALGTEKVCAELSRALDEAVGIRTATLTVDDIRLPAGGTQIEMCDLRMRSLFAMRFGSDKAEDDKQAVRDSAVRSAFNSPFWPFVLATTSVGQEGLDFHWYCHAVVHWNLPSNPVDLEQREGRIHRFKGHAVRKNVASKYGRAALCSEQADVWHEVFALAASERTPNDRGLVPYWLFPLTDGAWIERHVPLYSLSREEVRYRDLQRQLGAYRLVFGQPRQDELLAYLLNRVDPQKLREMSELLRVDLTPPCSE
jgi:hypothetical protein